MKFFTYAGILYYSESDKRLVSGVHIAESALVATAELLIKYPILDHENLVIHDTSVAALLFAAPLYAVPVDAGDME